MPVTLSYLSVSSDFDTLNGLNNRQLQATAHYSDGSQATVTTLADWSSSATETVVVDNSDLKGEVRAVSTGQAVISVSFMGVSSNSAGGSSKTITVDYSAVSYSLGASGSYSSSLCSGNRVLAKQTDIPGIRSFMQDNGLDIAWIQSTVMGECHLYQVFADSVNTSEQCSKVRTAICAE